ncbi:MAG: PAS domain S-box protein, partial [Myxococcales bacterium]|nr:PAS domain S-box protein [Myxococcales bacterium]
MSRVEETGAASDWPDRNEPRWTAIALVFASYAIAALAGAAWVPAGSLWLSPIVAAIFGRELGPRRGVSATVGALALTSLGVWLIDREAFEAISRLGLLPSLVASLATSWIAGSIADRWRASEAQQRAAAAALRISTARGDFGHAILRSEDLGDLCQRAANGFVELFGVVAAHVCTVDFVAGTVVEVAVAGRAIHRSRPVELRQSPFADVIANGEILRIDDDEGLLGYSDRPPAVIWASPLQSGSRLFGVVAIGLDQTIAAPLLEALGALGEQIAQLIEKHQTDNALRRSQFAMDHANVGVLLSDPDGKLSYANELACRLVGYRPREILDQTLLGLLAEDQHAEWQNQLDASGGASFSFETELVRSSRHRVPVELTVSQLSYRGENVLCLFARDITDQRATIAALREANERFELVTRGANDGHWDWDLRSDRVHTSPRWKAILGFGEDELAGDADHWIRRIHPQDVSDFRSRLAAHLRGATPHLEVEYRIEHKDGSWIWVLTRGIAVHDESGTAYRIAGSMTETTDRRQREEQLTESVFVDVVTGLANRALFLNRVELAVRRSKRLTSYRFAL